MKKVCVIISCLAVLHVCESFSLVNSFGLSKLRFPEGSFAKKQLGSKWVLRSSVSKGDEERTLTNEECDVLNLPYGTTLIGEMSDSMKLRLDKKKQGTYEKTNGLRYFGNEKFRKENYFGKQKLQVNVARMTLKMRRAEIEERMDSGMSYEAAVKEVDGLLKMNSANTVEDTKQDSAMTASLRQLFTAVDRDRSGTISSGEMATAFRRIRGNSADPKIVLRDVQAVLQEMDIDGSGQIDFDEFQRAADIFVRMTDEAATTAAAAAAEKPAGGERNWLQSLFNL